MAIAVRDRMSQFQVLTVKSGVVNVTASALSVLSAFLIARYLGAAALGTINALIPITAILSVLLTLGFQSAGVYYLSNRTHSAAQVISSLYVVALLVALPFLALCVLASWLLPPTILAVQKWIVIAVLITSIQQAIWLYMGDVALALARIDLFALVRLGWVCIYLLLLTVIIGWLGGGTQSVLVAFVASVAVAGIALALRLYRDGLLSWHVDPAFIRGGLWFGGITYVGDLAQYAMLRADQPLVAYLAGPEAAGFYSIAVRISELIWIGTNAVRTLVLARIALTPVDEEWTALVSRVSLTLSVGVAVGIGAVASVAIRVVLPRFSAAIPLVWVLLPGAVIALHLSILSSHLIGQGRVVLVSLIRIGTLIGGLLVYWAFTTKLAALGASIASVLIYSAEALAIVSIVSSAGRIRVERFFVPRRSDFVRLRMLLRGV